MPRIFAPSALPGKGLELDALLRDNEASFLRELRAVDAVERRGLWVQGAGRAWCKTARSCDSVEALITLQALALQDDAVDHLPGWSRTRAGMGAEGWRAGKPMMALLHVGSGGATVRKYRDKFKHPGAWQKLVGERCITPHAYTEQFGASLPQLKRWCDDGLLTRSGFAALLRADVGMVMQAVQRGEMRTAEILHRCATEEEGADWARRFLQGGMGPCPLFMQTRPALQSLALDMARRGQLCVDELLNCVPRVAAADMQALQAGGQATAWHALRAGVLDAAGVEALRQRGARPASIVKRGIVPPELARAWVEGGLLDKQMFLQASLVHWRASDPMPPYHDVLALAAWGPNTLLRQLPLPRGRQARMAYAARQMATHLWHRDAFLAMSDAGDADVAAGDDAAARAAPAVVRAHDAALPARCLPRACSVCLEDFDDARVKPAALAGCHHPPAVCDACLVTYVQKSDEAYPMCVKGDCKTPVLPEDVIRAGGGVRLAHDLAMQAVRRLLLPTAVWWACPTRGCVGGTLLGIAAGTRHPCRVCDQVAIVRAPQVDWQRDVSKILRLVDGLRPVAGAGEGEARIRECPKCGVPTEHDGGCAHMGCRECGADWNFSLGLSSGYAPLGVGDEQTYIPRAGLLQMAGLYEGVSPGPGLHGAVMANARRLQLLGAPQPLALMPPPLYDD